VPLATVQEQAVKQPAETATVAWTQGPDAGTQFDVPLADILGNADNLRGWYSGISVHVEKMPETVGRQQVEALKKAPGVKADEWKWLEMDKIIDGLFYPHGGKPVKSISRTDLKAEIRRKTAVFKTETLPRDETYYQEQYGVTLGGPMGDYTETFMYYPEKYTREVLTLDDSYVYEQASDKWYDARRDDAYDAWREGMQDYAWEQWHENLEQEFNHEEISQEEYDDRLSEGPSDTEIENLIGEPDDYDLKEYIGEPDYSDLEAIVEEMQDELDIAMGHDTRALYMSDHFGDDGERGDGGHGGNLMAHQRASLRWAEGGLVDMAEEYQSDWHQEAQQVEAYTEEGEPIRRGYKREPDYEAIDAANQKARDLQEKQEAALDAAYEAMVPGTRVQSRWGTSDIQGKVITNGASHHIFEVEWDPAVAEYMDETERTAATLAGQPMTTTGRRPPATSPTRSRWRGRRPSRPTTPTSRPSGSESRPRKKCRDRYAGGPPEAPPGHAWEELLFREAIRQAVSKGRTRYAWTTGETQAQRYNKLLASKLVKLEWDGEHLTGTSPEGSVDRWHWHQFRKNASDPIPVALSRALGSGLAKKLLADQPEPYPPDVFRIDKSMRRRSAGRDAIVHGPISEAEPGDTVVVGFRSDVENRQPQMFDLIEETWRKRYFIAHDGYWPPRGAGVEQALRRGRGRLVARGVPARGDGSAEVADQDVRRGTPSPARRAGGQGHPGRRRRLHRCVRHTPAALRDEVPRQGGQPAEGQAR
jgi:hypothetical protein